MDTRLFATDSSTDIRMALRLAANIIAGHETHQRRKSDVLTSAVVGRRSQYPVACADHSSLRSKSRWCSIDCDEA